MAVVVPGRINAIEGCGSHPRPRTIQRYAAIAAVLAWVLSTIPTSLSFAQQSHEATTARSRTPSQAEPSTGVQVVGVVDGDTIEICCVFGKREKVRYIGVNTPETKHPRKGVEPLGKEAAEANRRLVGGQNIRLEFDVELRDRYGRLLAYVYLEDGTFVNAWLVQNGYAQVMTIPPNVRYQELFLTLQREARQAQRGLWGQ